MCVCGGELCRGRTWEKPHGFPLFDGVSHKKTTLTVRSLDKKERRYLTLKKPHIVHPHLALWSKNQTRTSTLENMENQ